MGSRAVGIFVLKAAVVLLLLLFYASFLCHKTNLVTADLGRHIRTGELLFKNLSVLKTNFYSFTHPGFPVVNHHWLSGLVFFWVWSLGGFKVLSVFFIVLSLSAFLLFFLSAVRFGKFELAVLLSLLVIPVLAGRTEIRPEVFSYFLSGIFLWVFLNRRDKSMGTKHILILLLLQVVWANLHIYFFLGPLLALIFAFGEAARTKWSRKTRNLFLLAAGLLLSCLITPFGIKGLLYPFGIFANYGYPLAENQSVFFLDRVLPDITLTFFKILFIVSVGSVLTVLFSQKEKSDFFSLFSFLSLGVWALLSVRNFALFGFFALGLGTVNFSSFFKPKEQKSVLLGVFLAFLVLFVLSASWSRGVFRYFPYWREFGIGLEKGNSRPAEFLQSKNLQGNIFNDYDIGGYMIFHLFPQTKVFVDNRPEAYPASFFQKTYISMQENEAEWLKQDAVYNFRAIVFHRNDNTPWAQNFLSRRLKDPEWKLSFEDGNVVVFLRNG